MSELMKKPGWRRAKPVFALWGIELSLALVFGAGWVKDVPQLLAFATEVGRFAPFIRNFRTTQYTETLQMFMAITLCLIPLKVLLLYRCVYDTDPLPGRKTGAKADVMTEDSASGEQNAKINEIPSFRTVLLAILGTTFLMVTFLNYNENRVGGSRSGFFVLPIMIALDHGNLIHMWVSWNLAVFTSCAMCVAVTIHFIRQWWFFLFHKPEGDQK
jgi:hypothetical protein